MPEETKDKIKKCEVDWCGNKPYTGSRIGMCHKHDDMTRLFVWLIPRINLNAVGSTEPEKKDSLWVPEEKENGGT